MLPSSTASNRRTESTDQITDQYAPYCSELRYAVSSDYIELADYWWMQQEMNTLSVRHANKLNNCLYLII